MKPKNSSIAVFLLCGAVLATQAQATLVTYTNQASWEADLAAAATLEDFEGQVSDNTFGTGTAPSPNGDLTLSANANISTNVSIDVSPFLSTGAGINGNVVVNMRFLDNGSGSNPQETVTITLPSGISAFAFEYNNYDSGGDGTFLTVDGTTVAAFDSTVDGFFGVIDSTAATIASFAFTGDPDVGTGASAFNSFDDVRYGVSAIPEPSAALIVGCVVLGFRTLRRKQA